MTSSGGPPSRVDFGQAPFLAIWETTRSCALACRHCRAEAILKRDPLELSTEEGKTLIDQVAGMGTPILIFSGGDALCREDLEILIGHAKKAGLRTGAIPAATDRLTPQRVRSLKDAGLDQIAFSLDGPTAELHDSFRGVSGSFDKTLFGASLAREAGLPLQINTVFAAWNFPHLEKMVSLIRGLGVVFWEVFLLIPMGRGREMEGLTPGQCEVLFERMHRLNEEESFVVKLTEAQHYRRFVILKERGRASAAEASQRIRHILARPRGVKGGMGMSPQAVNSGKGFVFIDYVGNICPSGFLPIAAGNIRRHTLADTYRNAAIFRELRDPARLKGRCGLCEFSSMCGGSRARAWAMTGDYLKEDPACGYRSEG